MGVSAFPPSLNFITFIFCILGHAHILCLQRNESDIYLRFLQGHSFFNKILTIYLFSMYPSYRHWVRYKPVRNRQLYFWFDVISMSTKSTCTHIIKCMLHAYLYIFYVVEDCFPGLHLLYAWFYLPLPFLHLLTIIEYLFLNLIPICIYFMLLEIVLQVYICRL